jgi:dipeptidyl aminopeptidase/acylaminoacyl peptidase
MISLVLLLSTLVLSDSFVPWQTALVGSTSKATKKSAMTTSVDLIPREILFGNPTYASPLLSPDGTYLSYLAPSSEGVLNVFVKLVLEPLDNARMITNDSSRGIRNAFWAQDSTTILYLQDFEGDENFHLWAIDVEDPLAKARDLTPGENVKASNIMTNKRFPEEILVGTNKRDPKCFDMYRCNYKTGDLTLKAENPGDVVGWGSEDMSFQVRQAVVLNQEDSSTTIRVRDNDTSEWRDLMVFPYGEDGNMVDFCADDGKTCYMTSSLGRETTALIRVDLHTGQTIEELFSTDKCNCGGVTLDQDTKELRAVSYNYARVERKFFDKELEEDYRALESLAPEGAEVVPSSKTRDEKLWIVGFRRSDGPIEYVLYDQPNKTISPLFFSKPELLKYKLAPMEDVRIIARDGLELVGYLTKARTDKATPLVLLVHGGPWARDSWGFSAQAQWFANRGYATLQVNYRGSTGYSKTFLHKGDEQWGVGDMQHDLTDSVVWAIEQGVADKDNICIYGGSYGGYACLAGLTFTPDLYKCGVDIVGPSNIKTLLDSIPPYWGPLRNGMLRKIGDVDSDEVFNRKISPLYHVDQIKAPLLIGQGANDPRVKRAEADQIAFSMQDKGIPVEYVLYPDEGHGFARPDNRIDFNGRAELFLAKHLGGRAEDFQKPKGSTAQFPLETRVKSRLSVEAKS